MKEEEVNRCQIQDWYPKFKSLTLKTLIHELPEPFVVYLLDDDGPFVLPASIEDKDAFPNRIRNPLDEEDYRISEASEDGEEEAPVAPSFPELELKIMESIETLGGAVFPKLNWSAPKDAAWISPSGNLRCTSFSEIALLLRASDSLVHDLCRAYEACEGKLSSRPPRFFLALRKWYPSFLPEMEFRCFIRRHQLVGISQREVTTFYPPLREKKSDLGELFENFFLDNVRLKFESESYTFDVYLTRDNRVKLLDFNPWGGFTLPLLFTWEELEEKGDELEFRIVESQQVIRPGLKTAVPQDYLDTGLGSGWDEVFKKANDELQQQNASA